MTRTDASSSMAAGMRAKFAAAGPYLEVAPTVVEVVRDLELGEFDPRLLPIVGDCRAAAEAFADEWNLGGSMPRVLTALDRATS